MNPFPEVRSQLLPRWPNYFEDLSCQYQFHVLVHGVPICFEVDNSNLISQLQDFFPKQWQVVSSNPIRVIWQEPQGEMLKNNNWDDIDDPDCHFMGDFVSQRDFLTRKVNSHTYELVAHQKIDDGLFNFLRYLLPIKLLEQKKVIFHSSCVVSSQGEAYLFFGPSGAGKTTISQLCQHGGNVLGDDMNLLSFSEEGVFIEAASVGQRIYSKHNFGKKFKLNKAFWLVQDDSFSHRLLAEGQLKYYLSSFANLFWNQLESDLYKEVFSMAASLKKGISLYELRFKKNKEVWEYVQSIK